MTKKLLPCICGAKGVVGVISVHCSTSHTYCEREGYTVEEWNKASLEHYKKLPDAMRTRARVLQKEAAVIEKMIREFENDSLSHS